MRDKSLKDTFDEIKTEINIFSLKNNWTSLKNLTHKNLILTQLSKPL